MTKHTVTHTVPSWRTLRGVPALPRLRLLRERAALSQQELADASGVARTTILRIEGGAPAPYPQTVRKLAQALEVKPSDLMAPLEDA